MKRFEVHSASKDRHEFRKTASKTKRMNVAPPVFRGGIRL